MKYNKSEIMKAAWASYRSMHRQSKLSTYTFAMALKHAWMMAKKAIEKASKISFTGFASFSGYTFKLWEKNDIRRIYINAKNSNKGGYIALIGDTVKIVANGSASFAAREFLDTYEIA